MSVVETGELDDHAWALAAKVLVRLLWVAYAVMAVLLAIAVGGAIWVTRVDSRLSNIDKRVTSLQDFYVQDMNSRVHRLELVVAPGILSEAKRELDQLDNRLNEVEKKVGR